MKHTSKDGKWNFEILTSGIDDEVVIYTYIPKDEPKVLQIPATLKGCKVTALARDSIISDGWYNVSKIIIPEGIKIVYGNTFRNLPALKEVVFPRSIEQIAGQAFLDTSLKRVILPETIKYIGYKAFPNNTEIVFE